MRPRFSAFAGICALSVIFAGCGGSAPDPVDSSASNAVFETAPARPASPVKEIRDALGIGRNGELQKVGEKVVSANLAMTKVSDLSPLSSEALRMIDLRGTPVEDLSPISNHPIEEFYAEQSKVTDIGPLADMPLDKLYLSGTEVSDLTPLAGKSFSELNLVDSEVYDLTPLSDCSLGTLWVRRCPLKSVAELSNTGLVSLDVGETDVSDLSPLASITSLRRLHIAETPVTDLTPIAKLPLERLIFSPWNIETGLDEIRGMSTLQQLDVSFDDAGGQALRPEEFWKRWDAGEIVAPKAAGN